MTAKYTLEQALAAIYAKEPEESAFQEAQAKLAALLDSEKQEMIYFGGFNHDLIGNILLATRKNRLVAVDFCVSQQEFVALIERSFNLTPYYAPKAITEPANQIQAYLSGLRLRFDIKVDLSSLTQFQRQVLHATQEIQPGEVVTYSEIAKRIGNPKSVRAVGQALGRNPIPLVIPCHRVIAADGSLGGYSGGGGLETKAKLLKLEGAML
ncbi:MAG: methylated-DNA--[protein]-cysteine S-methyltransferase [Anaerolineales bacterium]|nr:methylated-DNA--[protein]-cysteine S-methyltransferase [Anaerolineales bacterium]